ncbi:MAG: hypothetical protein EOP02_10875 [Proteobacteria bacterium]|nr:MAG: hypothetical protein EOP02_10875 [Pseudomonadota bacterium]
MRLKLPLMAAVLLLGTAPLAMPAYAQALSDPVVVHPDPESLFTSPDPKLHRNKQAALGIVKVLLESGHWDRAGEFLTEAYIQHNPLAASGLDAVTHYFTQVAKVQPKPIPAKTQYPIVAVQAEGDFVTILVRRELPVPGKPGETYTTTWFDTWRFVDGKADEHWDPATLPTGPAAPAPTAANAQQQEQDRVAIEQLMWNYVRAIDGWKPDAYAAVFTEDGAFLNSKGRPALKKMVQDMKSDREKRAADGTVVPDLHHFMANQTIDFVSNDHAQVKYYWQTVTAGSPGKAAPQVLAAGRGLDDVVKVDGKWLIQNRNVAPPAD